MDYLEHLSAEVKDFIADLRAEVVAAELIEHGINQEDITFNFKGIKRRAYSRDIANIKLPTDDDENYKFIINRESIYDSLPEAIFHQPLNSKPFKSKAEILDEIKIQREEEIEARKFFNPIENVLFQNTPIPLSGYMLDKQVGQTKDLSTNEQIIARHKLIKQSKIDFESVITKSKVVTAAKKSNPPKAEKMWWLAVAPLAVPGTSLHGTGYALDIAGNNLETTRISKALGASLVFNEASHVHVEFKNWKDLI